MPNSNGDVVIMNSTM